MQPSVLFVVISEIIILKISFLLSECFTIHVIHIRGEYMYEKNRSFTNTHGIKKKDDRYYSVFKSVPLIKSVSVRNYKIFQDFKIYKLQDLQTSRFTKYISILLVNKIIRNSFWTYLLGFNFFSINVILELKNK